MTVLVVDDSILMRNIMKEVLRSGGATVAGEGSDGAAAIELNRRLRPDLIIMDVNMPVKNGLEATVAILAERPVPIVIFSNEVDARISFQALAAGAVDVIVKPDIDLFNDRSYTSRLMAGFAEVVRTFHAGRVRALASPRAGDSAGLRAATVPRRPVEAVVIGASTGGPVAVRDLLRRLPADFPAGIALVQHIEGRFDRGYAEWLDGECGLTVRLARAGDAFVPGEVLVAPSLRHLVCADRRLVLDDGPPVANQKPSVDRLFETAASSFGERLAGVLLTGMGSDGAAGCVRIKEGGGLTLVQDEASSLIFGMPKAAIERGGAVRILGLSEMPEALLEAVGSHG